MLAAARSGLSTLLIAPTGGGKTLAGFLPSLIDLTETPHTGLHTLYISPLKALAVDIHRNLETPIAEMGLPIRVETRTGDTPAAKRQRQRAKPPQMLLTTPESLTLLISLSDASTLFAGLRAVVIDELHALTGSKRGDLLALGLSRLSALAPGLRRTGLSATVAYPEALQAYLSTTGRADGSVRVVMGRAGAAPDVTILDTKERLPWSGHMAMHSASEVYEQILKHRTTLVFVNTRAQSELIFQALDKLFDNALGFVPEQGGWIRITLAAIPGGGEIRVANNGPPLPKRMQGQLFESMVSLRGEGSGAHLGLGLYVVRLVAEAHAGTVSAADLPDGGGVVFTLLLKNVDRPEARGDAARETG